jgi:hypothetical protein
MSMERAYYLTKFADEILPCDPTLEAWADWLSRPDEEWGCETAAKDGDTFEASVIRFEPDIIATRDGDQWSLSRSVGDSDFLAVRFGEGFGWSSDNIVYGDDMDAALIEWLTDAGDTCDEVEYVAVGVTEPRVRLRYVAGECPVLHVEGLVQ